MVERKKTPSLTRATLFAHEYFFCVCVYTTKHSVFYLARPAEQSFYFSAIPSALHPRSLTLKCPFFKGCLFLFNGVPSGLSGLLATFSINHITKHRRTAGVSAYRLNKHRHAHESICSARRKWAVFTGDE